MAVPRTMYEIEDRALVKVRGVLLLNQGRAESTIDERTCHGNEDHQHGDQPELLRHQQPGQDDRDHEVNALLPHTL